MHFARRLILLALVLISTVANGQVDTLTQHLNQLGSNCKKIRYLCNVALSVVSDQPLEAEKYLRRAESIRSNKDSGYFKAVIQSGLVKVYRYQGKLQEAADEADEALKVLEKFPNPRTEAELLLGKGGVYFRLGKHEDAIEALEKADVILIRMGLDRELSSSYNLLGGVQWARGNYPAAIKIFLRSLRIKEKIADTIGIANVSNNIGIIYDEQKDYVSALHWYGKALQIYRLKNNNAGLRNALNNVGIVHKNLKQYNNAIVALEESMALEKKAGNISGIGYSANNLGEVYLLTGAYPKAAVYFHRSIKLLENSGELNTLPACYVNLGRVKVMMGKLEEAEVYLKDGLSKAVKYQDVNVQKEAALWLYKISKERKRWRSALTNFETFHSLSDSLNGVQARKHMDELLVQYESEKKESTIKSLEKERAFQVLLLAKKRFELWILGSAIFILLVLGSLLFYTYYHKKLAFRSLALKNREVEDQKAEISMQRDEISRYNLRLTDSITYAKTIQQALLTPINKIKDCFPDFFYLNRPKDIVSGDFVWVGFRENKMVLVGVDCTGHGVPAAFMSVLAISHLNQFFLEAPSLDPAWFISQIRNKITENLHQRGSVDDSHDGLAIAIAIIDQATLKIDFAGAGMDILVVRKSKSSSSPIRLRGNRASIGYFQGKTDYDVTSVNLYHDDRLFIYSDGFPDQLGERTGRKLLYGGFEKMVIGSSNLPMPDQMQKLDSDYNEWKGSKDQVDDMMVFGLQV